MLFHVRLPFLNSQAHRAQICFITACLYVIHSLVSEREAWAIRNEWTSERPYETVTCVFSGIRRPSLYDEEFSSAGCVRISKRGVVYSVTLHCIVGALTSSSHVPHGLGVWFFTTTELCLLYQPPFLSRLAIVVGLELSNSCKATHDPSINVNLTNSKVKLDMIIDIFFLLWNLLLKRHWVHRCGVLVGIPSWHLEMFSVT